jgi:hypothetical protein
VEGLTGSARTTGLRVLPGGKSDRDLAEDETGEIVEDLRLKTRLLYGHAPEVAALIQLGILGYELRSRAILEAVLRLLG